MQAAPGHDIGFAPQDTGCGLFNIQQREQPERAFGMIKEQIAIGIFTRLASRRRAEQIEMLDAEPLQFGFVLLELGNNFAAFHLDREEGRRAAAAAVRLERWRIGAEHAGWKFGWRDAPIAGDAGHRYVETYCYAFAAPDLLENETEQLYWRTDIVQMTRYYMIEAARSGIGLSPRRAGFPV